MLVKKFKNLKFKKNTALPAAVSCKRTAAVALSIFVLLLSACSQNQSNNIVKINNTKIKVEIADTPELHTQGLSGKLELCQDCGMLFIFEDSNVRSFWMRNMNFPIDIIWINNNKIIGISENLKPEGNQPTKTYQSPAPANQVLEVNAGFSQQNGFKIGDIIEYEYSRTN